MSRSKNFIFNTAWAAIYQIVIMAVGFITPRIMLQFYGSEVNGLLTSITQFITYFSLVEAGLSGASVYSLYKPLAEKNYKKVSSIVVATRNFYNISGYIFSILILGLAIGYSILIESSTLSPIYVFALVIVLGFTGAVDFFSLGKYRALLTADQKMYIISLASAISIIVNTVIIVFMSYYRINIVIVRAVALSSILLRSFIFILYVHKNYAYINYKEEPDNSSLSKRWDALYLQILGAVHTGAPVIIATIFTNLKTVSIYGIYYMVIGGINGILGVFTSGLSASFGDIIVRKQWDILKKAYQEFEFVYYNLITIVYGIAMVTIMGFINLYTKDITDTNYNIPVLGFLFVLNGLLYNIKTPQGMMVISAGLYKETKIQTTIQGGVAVVLGVLLAPKFGLIGILIGSCISNLYRDVDLIFYIPKKVTGLPVINTTKRVIRLIINMILICIPFHIFRLNVNNYCQWVIDAIVVGSYAILIVIISSLFFDIESCKTLFQRIKGMLNKNYR